MVYSVLLKPKKLSTLDEQYLKLVHSTVHASVCLTSAKFQDLLWNTIFRQPTTYILTPHVTTTWQPTV